MITARKAREMVDAKKKLQDEKEKEKIENIINKAIQKGVTSCVIRFNISRDIKEYLLDNGYDVREVYDANKGTLYKIIW